MASPAILDFEALLADVSEDAPAGVAMRSRAPDLKDPSGRERDLGALFYEIKDARDEARGAEKQSNLAEITKGSGNPAPPPASPPDWRKVVELSTDILATTSKDLWIATWLIEGLARTDGFAGLRDGFRLVRQLSERHWDGLHPRVEKKRDDLQVDSPDDDDNSEDLALRFAQLSGMLDGVLSGPIYAIPITGSCPADEEDRTPRFSTLAFRQANNLNKLDDPAERSKRIDHGAVTLEVFNSAVEATSPESFRTRLGDIEACLGEFKLMAELLDDKCGTTVAPPTTKTRDALVACRDLVKNIAKDKLVEVAGEQPREKAQTQELGGPQVRDSQISDREEAFRQLLRVADFFRRTEPQSIVSYALEQVVRLGKMPLPDLLTELNSHNGAARNAFFRQPLDTGAGQREPDRSNTDTPSGPPNDVPKADRPAQSEPTRENKLW